MCGMYVDWRGFTIRHPKAPYEKCYHSRQESGQLSWHIDYATGWTTEELCFNSRQRHEVFLGTFAKLRQATIILFTSVCPSIEPSVRTQATTRLPLDEFSWNLTFEHFEKTCRKIQVSLKSDKNNGYFMWIPLHIFIISRSFLLRMKNLPHKSCGETQNTFYVW